MISQPYLIHHTWSSPAAAHMKLLGTAETLRQTAAIIPLSESAKSSTAGNAKEEEQCAMVQATQT